MSCEIDLRGIGTINLQIIDQRNVPNNSSVSDRKLPFGSSRGDKPSTLYIFALRPFVLAGQAYFKWYAIYVGNAQPHQTVRQIVFPCQRLSQVAVIFLRNLEVIGAINSWGRVTIIRTMTEMGDVEGVTFEGMRHCEQHRECDLSGVEGCGCSYGCKEVGIVRLGRTSRYRLNMAIVNPYESLGTKSFSEPRTLAANRKLKSRDEDLPSYFTKTFYLQHFPSTRYDETFVPLPST